MLYTVCVKVIEAYTSLQVYFCLYQLAIFLLLIPYVSIRHLKKLAPFSMLANVLTVVGLAITLFYCFTDLHSVTDRPAIASLSTLPLYFGIAIFTFEVCAFKVYGMPLLELSSLVWSPETKGDITVNENVQRPVTQRLPELMNLSYRKRPRKLNLISRELCTRRLQFHVIMCYKIIFGLVQLHLLVARYCMVGRRTSDREIASSVPGRCIPGSLGQLSLPSLQCT